MNNGVKKCGGESVHCGENLNNKTLPHVRTGVRGPKNLWDDVSIFWVGQRHWAVKSLL